MYWADKVAKEIIESGKFKPYWVDDMKTLSGFPTIGSLRGPLVHDFIYKALLNTGVEAKFSYIFNDFDPMDEVPPELKDKYSQYLGQPLKTVPSPKEGYPNYADFFAADSSANLRASCASCSFCLNALSKGPKMRFCSTGSSLSALMSSVISAFLPR